MAHRTALLLALVATSANAITDNFVDGQCATNDGADHFPYKSEAGDQFTDVISADYSLLWEVQYEDDYKIVKNTKTGDVHVLHQCGLDPPSNEDLPAYGRRPRAPSPGPRAHFLNADEAAIPPPPVCLCLLVTAHLRY